MEELHKLENIATMLTGMFSSDISNQETPITTAGQTSEELLNELKTLQEETEQRVSSFGHKLNQLELMSYKSLDDAAESTIQEVMDLISDINKSKYIIKSSEQTAEELKNKISEKQLEESGFKNQEEVKSKSDELWTKRRGLRDKFAGKYRFKKDIRLIESEINKLNNLEYAAHNSIRISNLHYSDENKFEELQGQVFSKMVSDLFSEYRSLLANTIQPEKTEGKLKHEVLTSVTEDYITKKFKPEIEESLGLPSPELVDKALSILREGFKDGIYHDHNASEEEKKRKQLLNEKLQSLPYQIKDIVQFGITRGDKVVDDAFAEIGSFISQAPSESQRLKILNSFSRSSRLLLNVFDKTNLPYEISNKKWTLQEKKEDIEESYSLKEKRKQLMKIDMEKFDIVEPFYDKPPKITPPKK